jgi:hypothetical protein
MGANEVRGEGPPNHPIALDRDRSKTARNPHLIEIEDMESFTQLFWDILEERGSEVVSAENGKILELDDLFFSFSLADRTLRGPYADLWDLINQEAAQVYSEYRDGNGPAHSGSSEIYKWNGHYLVSIDDFGWSGSVYSDLEEALRSEDLHMIGDAHKSVDSSELSYDDLVRILEVYPGTNPPESLLVNGQPWVPGKGS